MNYDADSRAATKMVIIGCAISRHCQPRQRLSKTRRAITSASWPDVTSERRTAPGYEQQAIQTREQPANRESRRCAYCRAAAPASSPAPLSSPAPASSPVPVSSPQTAKQPEPYQTAEPEQPSLQSLTELSAYVKSMGNIFWPLILYRPCVWSA